MSDTSYIIENASSERDVDNAEITLLVPVADVHNPEISIVIPAMNEEITIGQFVDWCMEGLARCKMRGEVIIIDSSSDTTPEIALSKGARVLKIPRRGIGRAYIDAIPFIRGRYVFTGDADCTYDFRELEPFVEAFRNGYEYIIGSRFLGYIEPGSMPPHHQYFGTPGTTWLLNIIYSTRFTDIHTGMRGITRDALCRMDLESQSWEWASEMVVKSVRMGLRTVEVPIRFLKDQEGRVSHHKRVGWFSPWHAAWINMKAMFVYGADFFLFRPGLVLLTLGLLLTLPMTLGPVRVGPVTFSLYWMLLGLTLSVLGLHGFYMGVLAKVCFDYRGEHTARWLRIFSYDRCMAASAIAFAVGTGLCVPLTYQYLRQGLQLAGDISPMNHLAVTGLLLVIAAVMTFTFTLALRAVASNVKHK